MRRPYGSDTAHPNQGCKLARQGLAISKPLPYSSGCSRLVVSDQLAVDPVVDLHEQLALLQQRKPDLGPLLLAEELGLAPAPARFHHAGELEPVLVETPPARHGVGELVGDGVRVQEAYDGLERGVFAQGRLRARAAHRHEAHYHESLLMRFCMMQFDGEVELHHI